MHGPFANNITVTPDSVTMRGVTLKDCIEWAYHVFAYQVSGPEAIDGARYDVAAKSAGAVKEAELRTMMQNLLADRFDLKLHRQTKETQAYVLTVGKTGAKFQESKAGEPTEFRPDQRTLSVEVKGVPVAEIIDPLARMFQMPVVDRTGLKGRYDVSLHLAKYIPQQGDSGVDPLGIVQRALEEELGLKLEPKKVALDFLVVDRAAKTPTEN